MDHVGFEVPPLQWAIRRLAHVESEQPFPLLGYTEEYLLKLKSGRALLLTTEEPGRHW